MAANICCVPGHESYKTSVCIKEYLVLSGMSVGHDMKSRWARCSLNWTSGS